MTHTNRIVDKSLPVQLLNWAERAEPRDLTGG
jgi:hypothetical protein